MRQLSKKANRMVLEEVQAERERLLMQRAAIDEEIEKLATLERFMQERVDALLGKPTQVEAVKSVLRSDLSRIWTIADIHDELLEQGFEFKAKSPKSSLSVSLKQLAERGDVDEVSVVGSGKLGYTIPGVLKKDEKKRKA